MAIPDFSDSLTSRITWGEAKTWVLWDMTIVSRIDINCHSAHQLVFESRGPPHLLRLELEEG